ncbi:MAG: cytochrome [Geminicoccaceae bacterium]|jgi:cytochrome c553|nr:cytochrome [Geminicoccaceae bacterium]MCE3247124.1 cytochrome [Geminicoccaceae bacterium]MDF2765536.1 cytochrome [Rhodospirillales bacterium]
MGLEGRKLRSVERGSALSRRHRCGFCHNPDFSGHDQIPRIAVQREHYLVKALGEYQTRSGAATTHPWWISRASSAMPRSSTCPYYLANWR